MSEILPSYRGFLSIVRLTYQIRNDGSAIRAATSNKTSTPKEIPSTRGQRRLRRGRCAAASGFAGLGFTAVCVTGADWATVSFTTRAMEQTADPNPTNPGRRGDLG